MHISNTHDLFIYRRGLTYYIKAYTVVQLPISQTPEMHVWPQDPQLLGSIMTFAAHCEKDPARGRGLRALESSRIQTATEMNFSGIRHILCGNQGF